MFELKLLVPFRCSSEFNLQCCLAVDWNYLILIMSVLNCSLPRTMFCCCVVDRWQVFISRFAFTACLYESSSVQEFLYNFRLSFYVWKKFKIFYMTSSQYRTVRLYFISTVYRIPPLCHQFSFIGVVTFRDSNRLKWYVIFEFWLMGLQ